MKGCLASGYPFVFGFTAYDGFESPAVAKSGLVLMPSTNESVVGGHVVLAVGYDDKGQRFIVMNPWADRWVSKGISPYPIHT